MKFKHGLTGSPEALFELFSVPAYLPHGVGFQLTRDERQKARRERGRGGEVTVYAGVNPKTGEAQYKTVNGPDGSRFAAWKAACPANALARFGYGETVDKLGVHFTSPELQRSMRMARKQERRS